MIAYLKGKILSKEENYIIVENNGIGYQVFVNGPLLLKIQNGEDIELHIYHHIREDAQILFGFASALEKKLFLLITSVSGVGPKTGMAFLSKYTPEQLIGYIAKGDLSAISAISGVGRKTAEKLIIEIKDKVIKQFPEIKVEGAKKGSIIVSDNGLEEGFKNELHMALSALGYNSKEIEKAIDKNSLKLAEITRVEEGIKLILKNL